jgi:hypothetical protein
MYRILVRISSQTGHFPLRRFPTNVGSFQRRIQSLDYSGTVESLVPGRLNLVQPALNLELEFVFGFDFTAFQPKHLRPSRGACIDVLQWTPFDELVMIPTNSKILSSRSSGKNDLRYMLDTTCYTPAWYTPLHATSLVHPSFADPSRSTARNIISPTAPPSCASRRAPPRPLRPRDGFVCACGVPPAR